MLDNVFINTQSSICIADNKIIYIDPFKIEREKHDADIIFITHDHYDHYSQESIEKIRNNNSIIVVPSYMKEEVTKYFSNEKILLVDPNNSYTVLGINFSTTYSYNINKSFHPKERKNVGYVIDLGTKYFITGDTDNIPEIRNVRCDVLFLPIGGNYTMNVKEAVELTKEIRPDIVVPTHYGSIVGSLEDGVDFKNLIKLSDIECKLFIK